MVRKTGIVLALIFLLLSANLAAAAAAEEEKFGGVGLQVVPTVGGELVVLNVIKDSPAMDGGLKPGDLIIQVDDFPLPGSDFKEVVSKYLWGKVGTSVTLKYLRPGEAGKKIVTLQRVAMKPEVVEPAGVKMITPSSK